MANVAEVMARLEDAAPSCAADGSRMRTPSFEQTTPSADGSSRQATYACDGCGTTARGNVNTATGEATWLNDQSRPSPTPGEPAGSNNTNGGTDDMSTHEGRAAQNPPKPVGENNADNLKAYAAVVGKAQTKVGENVDQLGAQAATLRRQAKKLYEDAESSEAPKATKAAGDELMRLAAEITKAAAKVSEANSAAKENLKKYVTGLKPAKTADETLRAAGAGAKIIAKAKVG